MWAWSVTHLADAGVGPQALCSHGNLQVGVVWAGVAVGGVCPGAGAGLHLDAGQQEAEPQGDAQLSEWGGADPLDPPTLT